VHRTWDTLKEQCDVSCASNKAYIPSTYWLTVNAIWLRKNWHISCRRVGECLSPLKSTAVSDRNSSPQQRMDNFSTRNLEPLWPRCCPWMNCALFLELNERLKTDVTIKRMCLNKGLAQRILEYENKQKEICSAMLSTSRIEKRQKSTWHKEWENLYCWNFSLVDGQSLAPLNDSRLHHRTRQIVRTKRWTQSKWRNGRWATNNASLVEEFKSEDSWVELLSDAEIKLPAAAAE